MDWRCEPANTPISRFATWHSSMEHQHHINIIIIYVRTYARTRPDGRKDITIREWWPASHPFLWSCRTSEESQHEPPFLLCKVMLHRSHVKYRTYSFWNCLAAFRRLLHNLGIPWNFLGITCLILILYTAFFNAKEKSKTRKDMPMLKKSSATGVREEKGSLSLSSIRYITYTQQQITPTKTEADGI